MRINFEFCYFYWINQGKYLFNLGLKVLSCFFQVWSQTTKNPSISVCYCLRNHRRFVIFLILSVLLVLSWRFFGMVLLNWLDRKRICFDYFARWLLVQMSLGFEWTEFRQIVWKIEIFFLLLLFTYLMHDFPPLLVYCSQIFLVSS